jgi:hypothetical protein
MYALADAWLIRPVAGGVERAAERLNYHYSQVALRQALERGELPASAKQPKR